MTSNGLFRLLVLVMCATLSACTAEERSPVPHLAAPDAAIAHDAGPAPHDATLPKDSASDAADDRAGRMTVSVFVFTLAAHLPRDVREVECNSKFR